MTFEESGQPPGLGAAPAALGRQAEFRNVAPRDLDALLVAGIVVVMQQPDALKSLSGA